MLRRKVILFTTTLMFLGLLLAGGAETLFPLRGDEGNLNDFQPQAAVWLSDDRILVSDSHLNNLQIFDTEGRRFRLFDAANNRSPAHYVGLTRLDEDEFLMLGSHYQDKNHPRYVDQRSQLHKFYLDAKNEDLRLDDLNTNISPKEPLRRTRMWGSSPKRQLEFCGISVSKERDIAWFGLRRPESEKGNLSLLSCSLQGLLEQDPDLQITEVDTGFKLPLEERCQLPTYLTDLAVLDDGSLLLLLTADDVAGRRFCTNSLWRWVPGQSGATLVKKDLAPENRATGLAVKSLGGGDYKVALVCDNLYEETKVPPRLVLLAEPLRIP